MTLPPRGTREIALLRARVAEAEAKTAALDARSRRLRMEFDALVRGGGSPQVGARARAVIEKLEREHAGLREDLGTMRGQLDGLLERWRGFGLDEPITNFRADTPVLLLPVRIETRYGAETDDLRVRIYPDQAHIDAHESELTDDERTAAQFYWNARWASATPEAEVETGKAAFDQLVRSFRPRRAAWIAYAMRPTNLAILPREPVPKFPDVGSRPTAWSRPSFAALLPKQWAIVGYVRDDRKELRPWFTKRTKGIPDRLNTSIDPRSTKKVPVDARGQATELPFDDDMRWLTDFAAAEAVGMAARIVVGDVDRAVRAASIRATTIERLVVYGVDPTLTAAEGAAALERALRAHVYSDGVAVLEPGTPTNNADAENAGYDASDAAVGAVMDPMRGDAQERGALDLIGRAFGIDTAAAHLDRIDNIDLSDQAVVGELINATWMATLGQTLDQMLDPDLSDADIAAIRAFCIAWLKPGGPLPALRIGRQPYGLLPVVAPGAFQSADAADRHLKTTLDALREMWTEAVRTTPTMARAGGSVTDTMEALLQHGPMARDNRYRRALGPLIASNSSLDPKLAASQQTTRKMIFGATGISQGARLGTVTLEHDNHRLGAPFVQARVATPSETLSPNYLQAIVGEAKRADARVALGKRSSGGSLLEVLSAHAMVYELDHTIASVVHDSQVATGASATMPPKVSMRIAEMVGVETTVSATGLERGGRPSVTVTDAGDLAGVVLTGVTAGMPVGEYVLRHIDDRMMPIWRYGASFRAACSSLDRLAVRPAAQIDRLFRGVLDTYSYRIDPWITALATKRLAYWRDKSGVGGLHIGGFGWVENVSRDRRPQSEGYVHAPSLQQAQTAAVLRSGHVAHRGASGAALDIDLSSRRVRLALKLLEGVAQGQSLAALLGYRFERSLRDTDIALAKFILPIRRRFPLKPPQDESVLSQQEAIAARDIVDGVKMIDSWRKGGNWLAGTTPMPTGAALTAVEACVAEIDAIFDATSDLLVAEGVHQLVGGNLERASAALAGLDRQSRPIDPEVIRTPRTGRAFTQRAGVLLSMDADPDGWPAPDTRAAAEPCLNRWVATLIGDPTAYRFAARLTLADGSIRDLDPVALTDLALSPISLLMLSNSGGRGEASEVQERTAALFTAQVTVAEQDANAELSLLGEAGDGYDKGLACFEALMARIRDVTGKHRAMEPTDLVGPGVPMDKVPEPQVIAARADVVRKALRKAYDKLEDSAASPDVAGLTKALDAASRAGASGASACTVELDQLTKQAGDVLVRVGRLLAKDEAEAQGAAALPKPADALAAQVRRLKILLGESFPVLPPFMIPDGRAGELMLSLADRSALLGGEPAVLHGWMTRMGDVRPSLAELAGALIAAEVAGGSPASLAVAQFPHAQGARWIGIPFSDKTPDHVDLSLVVHAPDLAPGDATPKLFAGLMSDSWTEVVPSKTETTAISFHYDAPGARPPQAMLLAVHPDPAATQWELSQILATINEAADLAAIRAVRPQDLNMLGAVLPLIYLPDNYSHDAPGVDFRQIREFVMANTSPVLANIMGKD